MNGVAGHLGFGCVGLTAMDSYFAARKILDNAFGLGIRHFDTAPLYGRGYSEMIVGDFAKNQRDQVTIATKFGLGEGGLPGLSPVVAVSLNRLKNMLKGSRRPANTAASGGDGEPELYVRKITRDDLAAGMNNSLRRLKTSYIDYYLFHEGVPAFLTPEALDYLQDLKNKGVVRKIGLAINSAHLLKLEEQDIAPWDVLQYEGGVAAAQMLLERYPEKEHIHHSCLKHGMGASGLNSEEKAGHILASAAKLNPSGKILFSTKNRSRLHQNIKAFQKHFAD